MRLRGRPRRICPEGAKIVVTEAEKPIAQYHHYIDIENWRTIDGESARRCRSFGEHGLPSVGGFTRAVGARWPRTGVGPGDARFSALAEHPADQRTAEHHAAHHHEPDRQHEGGAD